jgi:hypothetical protein
MDSPENKAIIDRMLSDIRELKSAFPKNEDGEPDYLLHRAYHKEEKLEKENAEKRKENVKTNILTWGCIGIIAVVLTTIIQHPSILLSILSK